MEKIIKDSMNDLVLETAYELYGIDKNTVDFIGGFENFVYEFKKDDKSYILRFVHSTHRSFEQVESEIEFIDYLANNKANVSTIVVSLRNNIVEKIMCNDTYFSVSVFIKALGGIIRKEQLTDEFIYSFGREIGKLHILTKTYKPLHIRHQWYEKNELEIAKRVLEEKELKVVGKLEEIILKLKQMDQSVDSYGLIHGDLHFGNIFVSEDSMTFFDFDDCAYQPFINEFAVIIFNYVAFTELSKKDRSIKANDFLKPLLKGYEQVNKIQKAWFDYFHLFLKYREAVMFIMFKAEGEELCESPFGKRFLSKRFESIMNDTQLLEMNLVLKDII